MTTGTALIIGASGTTGTRIVAQLAAAGYRANAASRRATAVAGATPVAFDWYDPSTHFDALDGVDRVYLIPPLGESDPASVMLPFLKQARAVGVLRAVLLSSSAIARGGPAVGMVHDALPDLFDQWAVLRPSWFMQNFTGTHPHATSIRDHGTIWTAAGDGRVGFIDAGDIASVAVHALTDEEAPNDELILTGPEALSFDDIATRITEISDRPVAHRRLSYDHMVGRLSALMPESFATMLTDMDVAIAEGSEDRVTDTVQRLTGQFPRSFRDLLAKETPWNH
ncbi:NAD(P)H-binding protein [Arthrobacter zhaoguopingii]|uniref:NAD(P)H-binding protein n=1 Tax=Arthrobacter zhaoguopingii TaxID=2681491 RepID=UPI0019160599|nr:NAD(P)H-binding protein [Arthrobacter zhaoguopingii]